MSNFLNPVELTSALIKCRSITPISAGSIDLIISYLEPMGFTCTKVDFGQGDEKVENLYARFGSLEPIYALQVMWMSFLLVMNKVGP